MKVIIVPILLIILVPFAVMAEVYKWKDEHGRVHYGDRPNGQDADEIVIEEKTGSPDHDKKKTIDRKVKQERLLQLYAEEREQKKQEKIDQQNEKITRKNTCNKARNYHKEILNSGYLYEEDDNGEKRILSIEEFEAHLAETEKLIEKYCT